MAIIDRVKFDGSPYVLVWRAPGDDLTWGTQVIVNQSQEAIFYKGGQALDVLPPGTHTLKTANIPLLRPLIEAPFGGNTPFAAEIYYVNKTANLDVKWGTTNPIPVQDPKFNVFLPVRAFGQFGVQVADSRAFVTQIVGTLGEFNTDNLNNYFRGVLLTRAKDYIAAAIIKQRINVLEISAHLQEMSEAIGKSLEADFAKFGVKLVNFFLNSVDVPADDDTVIRLKKALADRAEMDILGSGYNTKRTFDTLEKAAGNEGGGAGAGVGLGMGLGAGVGAGNLLGGLMSQVNPANAAAAAPAMVARPAGQTCPACNAEVAPGAKFCAQCGKQLGPAHCAKCQAELAPGAKFCSSCGEKTGV
jgi:membrane protease subunit (stomatin/prohibitin family)